MKRRELFKNLAAIVPFTMSFIGMAFMSMKFISPPKSHSKLRRIFALNLRDLKVNETMKLKDLRGKELVLVRTGEREVKALSTVCTHLGCAVHWKSDKGIFFCPCHDGVFDSDGKVVSGPPPRDLSSYDVELEGDNVYIFYKDV